MIYQMKAFSMLYAHNTQRKKKDKTFEVICNLITPLP